MSRPNNSALSRICAALMLLSLLSGCIAALAVPLMTLTGVLTEKKRTRAQIVAALPAANAAALAAVPEPAARTSRPSVQLTSLTEMPPPSGGTPTPGGPWRDFAAFALDRARGLAAGGDAVSALLTPEGVTRFQTQLRPCVAREAAVVIDIDPGASVFVPGSAGRSSPDIAATVARLREAGVIVLWVSQASANDVAGVATALKASGLDPTGRDPILLVRNEDERKQVLREEANQTVCVVAMAGDRRSDFDELFDYLRDQRLATMFDGQLGAGWFLVPPLFGEAPTEPPSAVAPAAEDGGR
jgi:hypothetical protein